jgi:tetratricopeptide (TPR) repeat protein
MSEEGTEEFTAEYWIELGEKHWVDSNKDEEVAKEAMECFDRALDRDPLNAHAWSNKGLILKNLNRLEDALMCYEKALEINPSFVNGWYNKGVLLRKMNRFDEAQLCMKKVLSLDPGHFMAKQERDMMSHRLKKKRKRKKGWLI